MVNNNIMLENLITKILIILIFSYFIKKLDSKL